MRDYKTIGIPLGTRLMRVERTNSGWRLWLATRDFIYGTYMLVNDDGSAYRVTERLGEGPETLHVRLTDEVIGRLSITEQHLTGNTDDGTRGPDGNTEPEAS